jgi:uncharacterized protein
MNRTKNILTSLIFGVLIQLSSSCGNNPKTVSQQTDKNVMIKKSNPVVYFEIPVTDIDRA